MVSGKGLGSRELVNGNVTHPLDPKLNYLAVRGNLDTEDRMHQFSTQADMLLITQETLWTLSVNVENLGYICRAATLVHTIQDVPPGGSIL